MANAWTYEQKFNSLNNGTIVGQDSWAISNDTQGTKTVIDTLSAEGTKCLQLTGDNGYSYRLYRNISAITNGTVYVSLRGNSSTKYLSFRLAQSATEKCQIGLQNGYIVTNNFATQLQAYSVDNFYRIGIAFECGSDAWEGLSADTYKVNINGGAWSSAYSMQSTATQIDRITIEQYSATELWYVDYISPNYSDTPVSSFIPKIIIY